MLQVLSNIVVWGDGMLLNFLTISIANLYLLIIIILFFFLMIFFQIIKRLKYDYDKLKKDYEFISSNKKIYNNDYVSIDDLDKEDVNVNSCNVINNEELISNINEDSYFDVNEYVGSSNDNSKYDYLKDISDKMESEIKPTTVELTDYEKEQEDNAIISYKDLVGNKSSDDISAYSDSDFIDYLKSFRNDLEG